MPNLDELNTILHDNYPLQILKITPIKGDLFQLHTDCGYKRLTRVRLKPPKLNFAQSVVKDLRKIDYRQLAQIYPTESGQAYFSADYSHWILSDWINGRQINLGNWHELELVTRGLAKLHSALKQTGLGKVKKRKNSWNKWPEIVLSGQKFFRFYLQEIKRSRPLNDFQQVVLDHSTALEETIRSAAKYAYSRPCQDLIKREAEQQSLIYRLMREDQIWIDLAEQIYFINPLKMEYDVQVKDLAIWIKRIAKKTSAPQKTITQVIQWYNQERGLSSGEEAWLSSYLFYPEKVLKVIERYYSQKKAWPEEGYLRKLQKYLIKQQREIDIYQQTIKMFNRLEDF